MPKILKEYLTILKYKNYSKNTIKMYYYNLMEFFNFIKRHMDLKIEVKDFNVFIFMQVKEWDIDSYLVSINYNSAITREKKLTAIRMFYKYLIKKYPNIDNPVKQIYIQKEVRLPKYLNLQQAKKLIDVFNKSNSLNPERDNLIISILLTTGIRRAELSNIIIKNIDLDNKTIKLIGKRNKERVIYMAERTRIKIKTFIDKKDKSIPLIVSSQNKRLSEEAISSIVKKAYKLANLNGYTTHSLRHTYASIIYQDKEDILLVKELLGHQSLASTQIYTHLSSDYMRNIMEKNPLNIGGM